VIAAGLEGYADQCVPRHSRQPPRISASQRMVVTFDCPKGLRQSGCLGQRLVGMPSGTSWPPLRQQLASHGPSRAPLFPLPCVIGAVICVALVPEPALRYISNRNYMGTNVSIAADIRATMDALRCLIQELRVSARAVEQHHGVSGAQLFVLHQLAAGEALSVSALAERTFTHQSSVSVVVSRLAKRGLVSRRNGADDARRTDVRLTARGRALLGRAPEVAQQRLIAGLQGLQPSERRSVARGLAKLVRQMGLRVGTPSLFFEDADAATRRGRRAPHEGALVNRD